MSQILMEWSYWEVLFEGNVEESLYKVNSYFHISEDINSAKDWPEERLSSSQLQHCNVRLTDQNKLFGDYCPPISSVFPALLEQWTDAFWFAVGLLFKHLSLQRVIWES